jgi:hypothetical protein
MTSVPARKWESKAELQTHLESTGTRTLIVGLTAEAPRTFCSFAVASSVGVIEVGIHSSGLGSEPALALLERGRRAIVGHDTWLTWIDLATPAIVASRRLGGVFFEFLPVDRDDQIVVLHELGALRVDSGGSETWAIDTDVVEDSRVDARGNLVLTVMDQGPRIVVSLETGKVRLGNAED